MNRHDKGFTLIELGVVISIIAILALAVTPRFFDISVEAEESAAHQLLHSLKTAASIYTSQEYLQPEAFDNFVVLTGDVTTNKTISLQNIQDSTKTITMPAHSKTLSVEFNEGLRANYYLNGCDVTADINI